MYFRRRNSMFRALFRRLTLAASLVVLLSVSLSWVVPTASAKSLASSPCPVIQGSGDTSGHCYVSLDVTAPAGGSNLGASASMQIFKPTVAPGDLESVSQMTIFGCWPSCSKLTPSFDIEVGWIVDPAFPWIDPNGTVYRDSNTHLFVFVRNSLYGAPDNACMVQPAWTCGFVPYGGAIDHPGEVLLTASPTNASQVPVSHFVIVYSNGNWWIQYNSEWLGYIDGHWFNSEFNSVAAAEWSGEVAVYSNQPATQMGSGTCGTVTNTSTTFSAHMYGMLFAESGYTVPALSKSLKSKQTVTAKKYYNGSFYSESDGSSTLSYGGPTGCP
jgi:hypothetical protein